jgi:hypothetical protein
MLVEAHADLHASEQLSVTFQLTKREPIYTNSSFSITFTMAGLRGHTYNQVFIFIGFQK